MFKSLIVCELYVFCECIDYTFAEDVPERNGCYLNIVLRWFFLLAFYPIPVNFFLQSVQVYGSVVFFLIFFYFILYNVISLRVLIFFFL